MPPGVGDKGHWDPDRGVTPEVLSLARVQQEKQLADPQNYVKIDLDKVGVVECLRRADMPWLLMVSQQQPRIRNPKRSEAAECLNSDGDGKPEMAKTLYSWEGTYSQSQRRKLVGNQIKKRIARVPALPDRVGLRMIIAQEKWGNFRATASTTKGVVALKLGGTLNMVVLECDVTGRPIVVETHELPWQPGPLPVGYHVIEPHSPRATVIPEGHAWLGIELWMLTIQTEDGLPPIILQGQKLFPIFPERGAERALKQLRDECPGIWDPEVTSWGETHPRMVKLRVRWANMGPTRWCGRTAHVNVLCHLNRITAPSDGRSGLEEWGKPTRRDPFTYPGHLKCSMESDRLADHFMPFSFGNASNPPTWSMGVNVVGIKRKGNRPRGNPHMILAWAPNCVEIDRLTRNHMGLVDSWGPIHNPYAARAESRIDSPFDLDQKEWRTFLETRRHGKTRRETEKEPAAVSPPVPREAAATRGRSSIPRRAARGLVDNKGEDKAVADSQDKPETEDLRFSFNDTEVARYLSELARARRIRARQPAGPIRPTARRLQFEETESEDGAVFAAQLLLDLVSSDPHELDFDGLTMVTKTPDQVSLKRDAQTPVVMGPSLNDNVDCEKNSAASADLGGGVSPKKGVMDCSSGPEEPHKGVGPTRPKRPRLEPLAIPTNCSSVIQAQSSEKGAPSAESASSHGTGEIVAEAGHYRSHESSPTDGSTGTTASGPEDEGWLFSVNPIYSPSEGTPSPRPIIQARGAQRDGPGTPDGPLPCSPITPPEPVALDLPAVAKGSSEPDLSTCCKTGPVRSRASTFPEADGAGLRTSGAAVGNLKAPPQCNLLCKEGSDIIAREADSQEYQRLRAKMPEVPDLVLATLYWWMKTDPDHFKDYVHYLEKTIPAEGDPDKEA